MKNPIDLVAQAAAFADRYNMLPPGSTILVALSGGGDSMALLSVLEKLAQERDLHLHAAHFNHQLRGEESQRDETFVTEWCEKRNIPLIIGQGDVAQEAKEQGKGVEETARAMRYGFLTQAAQDLGADKLATAHHADDNAETVLLHLVRGAGLDGLTGIPPVRGILIRPLLAIPQSDIAAYLEQEGIPHVEDSSNFDLTYARNRLRQEVVPVLQELNPAFISTLTANLDHLREDRDLLEGMAQRAIQEARLAAEAAATTFCVGTSILNPCKPFMDLWYQVSENLPGFKLHIVPFEDDHQGILGEIAALGEKFDFLVGACDSRQWLDRCNFFPLGAYRHCVAVPREHPLARKERLTVQDLYGYTLMMVKRGDSTSVDQVRNFVEQHPAITIEDTPQFYDMEVFNRCVQTRNPLMTLECWSEVHPSLVTLPVDWDFTIPYGILYALHPDGDTLRFLDLVREQMEQANGA